MKARTRKDWVLWGALGCALVGIAHAEYTLAVAAHFHPWVALAVPGALDLYVIRALQQGRDVFVAVMAMVAANVASHLIAAGVLEVDWRVISAVGAVAPLIVWRVYSLRRTRTRRELLWGLRAGAGSAPAECTPEDVPEDVPEPPHSSLFLDICDRHGLEYAVPAGCTHFECANLTAPDHVPAWMDEEYPESALAPESEYTAPVAVPVPGGTLSTTELAYLSAFDTYLAECEVADEKPTIRGTRKSLGCGQKVAQNLLKYRGYPQ